MTEEIDYITRYEEFLKSYKTEDGETPYNDAIARLSLEKHISVSIDFNQLLTFDPELAAATKENPQRAIDAASAAIRRILRVVDPDYSESIENLHARFKEVPDRVSVRFIRAEHIGQLIMVDALVTRVSDVKPLLVEGVFQCRQCQEIIYVQQANQFIPPSICTNDACRSKGPFDLIPERSKFVDWQKIRLQEKPEELPPGALPRALDCILQDDLVDIARPGDPCRVVGILRSTQDTTARTRRKAPTFSVFLATNYVAVSEREADRVEIEPKEEEAIRELAKDPLIHRKLVNSIAPSIYGLTDIKEAVCLLLFGGVRKVLSDGVKIRGDSNILLVGDPGTAKSIHGTERIYVGYQEKNHIQWNTEPIGSFVDKLMTDFSDEIIENGHTEILSLPESISIFTQAMDPFSLKIRRSKVYEVSRHQSSKLVRIKTRSGRSVIATPDHSFTTILNGRLEVLKANELKPGTYLPVARRTNLECGNSVIDFSMEFLNDQLVYTDIITNQIEQVKTGVISAREAAAHSNVTPNTMGAIIHGQISLPEGSWLRCKRDNSWFPKTIELGEPIGRIIGLYLAEGNVEKPSIRFSNLNKMINSTLENDLESTFGKASPFEKGVFLCQSSIAQWFKEKFGSGAREKRIPEEFLNFPYSFKCALLSGYFSGDGTISKHSTSISATTASRKLAYQISDLLATIGIFTTIKERTITKGPYRERIYYQIRIQSEDILQFNKHIHLILKSKQKALDDLVETLHKRRRYQLKDIIPNFGRLLNDTYKELRIKSRRGTWTRQFLGELRGKTHRQRVGRKYLQSVVSKLSTLGSTQSPTLTWLHTLAYSDLFWDPITSIEKINQHTAVYDIATSDGHFVLAEGNLIVHNSQLLKYVAQIAPRGLYTSGKGSTAAGLCVGPDSQLVLSSGVNSIMDVVESHFEEQMPIEYDAGIQFVENGQSELQVFHSKNLQMELGPIDKLWKIKSPELMVRIRSRTGKTLELTPKTSILSLNESLGLVWKQASQLCAGDRVATSRAFHVTGLKIVPLISDILKGYSKPIRIWNIEPKVRALINQLKIQFNLSTRKIAKRLSVSEDTLYRWMNKERIGNISFDTLLQLCQMLDEKIEDHLPDHLEVQAKYGQSIILPKKLKPEWFYILGLLFGDGRVYRDKREDGYGGTTIGFSNSENKLIDSFSHFFETLSLNTSISEKSETRPQEIRVFSSVIYHILSYFGLPQSPKSNKFTANADILYFDHKYLSNFIKGLYDTDGWICTRSNGSSHLGLSSISKPLIEFVQIALLSKNIQSFIRKRDSVSTVLNSGNTIEGRYPRYSLIISNHSDIKRFAENFGFNHPQKQKKLLDHCKLNKKHHSNLDNIPHVSSLLWQLLDFYNHKVFQLNGQNIRLTPSRFRNSISSSTLSSILDQLQLNWHNHRISVPFQKRHQLFQELQTCLSPEELMKISDLSKSQIYEFFNRKNRNPTIPIGIIYTLLTSTTLPLSKEVKTYWKNQINAVLTEHQAHKELYELLKSLSNSEIYWDEVTEVTTIPPTYPYVYDLTIPGTHNFVVNTFIVHNTAAVLRDPDTEGFALEAGALVLADRGTACLHPSSRILVNNKLITIEEVYSTTNAVEAISNGEVVMVGQIEAKVPSLTKTLDVIDCKANYIRKRAYSGSLVKISTETGFHSIVTPDHMLLDGASLDWKTAQTFEEGDYLIAPLKLPDHKNSIQIFDIIPDNWIVCLDENEKHELRAALVDEFGSLVRINRFFGLRRDVLSGHSQMKVASLRKILSYLGLLDEWKKRKLSFGRKQSGERLKVSEITPEMAYFFGFVFGDGWLRINSRRSSLSIRQSLVNQDQIYRVLESFSAFSKRSLRNCYRETESEIRGLPVRSQSVTLTANSNLLAHIYNYLTQNNLSNLLKLPNRSLSAFLAGVVDTDGCITIKKKTKGNSEYHTVHIDIQCSNSWLENQAILLALRRFDCYGRLKPDREIIHIQITARNDVKALLSAIRPSSVKVKPLPQLKRTISSLSDRIPSKPVSHLANQISKLNTSMLVEKGLWSTIYNYKYQRYSPSRGQLQKIQSILETQLSPSQHETINNLLKRDYFLDPIISIEKIPYKGPVYDLHVPQTHNFLADGQISHNCIDEFDKMRPQDRTAIHEAMEQHSYHPSTEILLSTGERVKIGSFVDDLFDQNRGSVVQGVDCEILDGHGLEIELYSMEKNVVQKVVVDRISRHPAPRFFYRITYSNGRSIVVTPEHPIFIFEGGKITTTPASEVEIGSFIPALRRIPCGHNPGALLASDIPSHHNTKSINLPERLTPNLSRILGYFVSEGYSYNGASAELGFANTNRNIINEVIELMRDQFDLEGIDYVKKNRTLRFVSSKLRDYFQTNFPELMKLAKEKRAPKQVFVSGEEAIIQFLRAAFLGDGSLESEGLCYRTSSKGLAYDYQDLLLCLQIQSRVNFDSHNDSYKVYIRGTSLPLFFDTLVAIWDPRRERIEKLVERSRKSNYNHDVFPAEYGIRVKELLQRVGVPYKGTFYKAVKNNQGIARILLIKHLNEIRNALQKARQNVDAQFLSIRDAREILCWSQETTAKKITRSRSFINYIERGGYSDEILKDTLTKIVNEIHVELNEIGIKLEELDSLLSCDLRYLRVKEIEQVENSDEWACPYVYDLTIEPFHRFISHGLLLHNTVSIAKAGIVATLNARTAILAAANPNLGRYVAERSFSENVNLPVTLLSRFDLIFTLTDLPEAERDERTADHIIALHKKKGQTKDPPINADLLRKYIAYARRSISPTLTDEALNVIKDFYLGMRKSGERENAPVPITARQLESLIRLTEAHAKMALRDKVLAEDAQASVRLVQVSLQQVGFDSETGQYDIDNIMIGRAKSQRDKLQAILTMIRELEKETPSGVTMEKLEERAELDGISATFVRQAVIQLRDKDGLIFEPRPGRLKYIKGA